MSGADRAAYLQGLLTNDIAALGAGQGCYAAYLTPQGRMIADMHVYELGDAVLLTTTGAVKDRLLTKLDRSVFAEDVRLGDLTDTWAQLAVIGPQAAPVIASLVGGIPAQALAGAGVPRIDDRVADTIRIEAGIPLFHRDMDEETIPLEAGIESRAISFTKGCYVGQEVIVRVLHRGHGRVARKLVGLRLDGDRVPDAGTAVTAGDRDVGRVTSGTWSPALKRPIALAYVHSDFVAAGTAVAVDGIAAEVAALPFVPPTTS